VTKIIPRRAFAMVEAAAKLDATIVIAQAEIAIKLIAMTVFARAEIVLIPAMMSIVDVRLVKMDNARIFPLMTATAVASQEFAKMDSALLLNTALGRGNADITKHWNLCSAVKDEMSKTCSVSVLEPRILLNSAPAKTSASLQIHVALVRMAAHVAQKKTVRSNVSARTSGPTNIAPRHCAEPMFVRNANIATKMRNCAKRTIRERVIWDRFTCRNIASMENVMVRLFVQMARMTARLAILTTTRLIAASATKVIPSPIFLSLVKVVTIITLQRFMTFAIQTEHAKGNFHNVVSSFSAIHVNHALKRRESASPITPLVDATSA